jgi:RNase adapter protein RapZ
VLKKKKLLIVTGLSGAGKHQVLYQLEDLGYFCVDNLPAPLLIRGVELLKKTDKRFQRLAVGVDVRSQIFLKDLQIALNEMKKKRMPYDVLFLETAEAELMRRFAETRRPHPLRSKKTLQERIRAERTQLSWLREAADFIIDTTRLTTPELRRQLVAWLDHGSDHMHVAISSFGYKYGLPGDADLVFDMRFLPNPFYVATLKKHTGLHQRVQQFVLQHTSAQTMLERMTQMIRTLLPDFIREGKTTLHVALGCTGGQHRSVVMANALKKRLPGDTFVYHRELRKVLGETDAKKG